MAKSPVGVVTKLEFIHTGFREILTGPAWPVIREIADAVKRDAMEMSGLGEKDYFADVVEAVARTSYRFPGRAIGTVSQTSDAARYAEATEKVLLKAALKRREI